jgi:hypothetical protein
LTLTFFHGRFPTAKTGLLQSTRKTSFTVNGLYRGTYGELRKAGKMPLTSFPARPTLQSQTGFGGCDAVESDSPIKRNPWCAGGLVTGRTMLIRKGEHFLLLIGYHLLP